MAKVLNFSNKAESLEAFIKRTRNRFILTSAPICNMIEGWPKNTTFYLNSYGKLSSSSSNMDFEQVKNPFEINKFWTWLFKNQNRIGELVDLNKIRKKIGSPTSSVQVNIPIFRALHDVF